MLSLAARLLLSHPWRCALTVAGVSLSVTLISFLSGVYRGVAEGSVAYVRESPADVWVVQTGTTNILRGFSLLTNAHGTLIGELPGVAAVAPVLFRLSTVLVRGRSATAYVTGYLPGREMGGPVRLVTGRGVRAPGEIVLDRAFAVRHRTSVGDSLTAHGLSFVVVGIADGSNMFVIQYAFVHIDDVRRMYGLSDLVSAFLVRLERGANAGAMARTIEDEVPGVAAYDRDAFLANNEHEMKSGFLPVILALQVIGAALLSLIVGMLLTLHVLEYRAEFAVLKAVGAPRSALPQVLFGQSFMLVGLSSAGAAFLYPLLTGIVERLTPEVASVLTGQDLLELSAALFLLSIAGGLLPLWRSSGIYPTEAFR